MTIFVVAVDTNFQLHPHPSNRHTRSMLCEDMETKSTQLGQGTRNTLIEGEGDITAFVGHLCCSLSCMHHANCHA
jgi:hypothetical protein